METPGQLPGLPPPLKSGHGEDGEGRCPLSEVGFAPVQSVAKLPKTGR